MAAGLTLGLATVEPFGLQVVLAARPEDCTSQEERAKLKAEQDFAVRILPLVKDHHLLLVTLLLFNTVANEALPVFLDRLLPSWAAVLLSVSVVLVCGEILPSAVFTGPNQFAIASALVPLVQLLQVLFFPVARPIANVLDQMFKDEVPEEGGPKYSRAELRAMLVLHGPEEEEASKESQESHGHCCATGPLGDAHGPKDEDVEDEVIAKSELRMLDGVLSLRDRYLSQLRCFTPLKLCRIASGQEQAVDVVARCALNGGDRCVVVLHDGSTAVLGAPPSHDGGGDSDTDVGSPTSPKLSLRASAVRGTLRMQEMLKGGSQKLSELCTHMVTVDEDESLMEVMGKLRSQNCSRAIVVRPSLDGGDDTVRGVVHVSQVVSFLMTSKDCSREGTKDMWSPTMSPGFRQVASSAHRRHPLARARSNLDAGLSSTQTMMRFRRTWHHEDAPKQQMDRSHSR
ncbi:CBSDUF7 [Symbiodinium natans]|uniref:CBSDUF7 protein n=1 Tax=Symbiodinium natans TaxID=878477 RepID=A0A812MBE2_9DINO|nr:CBSDUF7 [Symbiodinium natans]